MIMAGNPRGSVLGAVLYTVYTSDLLEAQDVAPEIFADDIATLVSNKSLSYIGHPAGKAQQNEQE